MMRRELAGLGLLVLAACAAPTADVAPPPAPAAEAGYRPALDTRTWRGDVAAPRTQMAVLGSAHIGQIEGFDAANLEDLLDKLAAFNPTIITQEGVSGEQCETLRINREIYPGTADDYCWGLEDAQAATGLGFAAARAEAEKMLANWPETPQPAQRRRLAALFIASGDRPSAQVQWLQLPPGERRIGDGVDEALLKILMREGAPPNERMEVAAVLAARLGLERVHAVDDQTATAVWARAGTGMEAAIEAHWNGSNKLPSPAMLRYQAASAKLSTPEDVTAFFRVLNSPDVQLAFVESDFRDALKLPGPDYYGQQYYAYNDLRNWRMAANIIEVSANEPGARVLNVVGASHKAYYEAYLDMVPYVELVDMEMILKD